MRKGKNYVESAKLIDRTKLYDPNEAIDTMLKTAKAKFDETVEVHIKLGVDSRHADQQVRGAIVLPHGTGRQGRRSPRRRRRLCGRYGHGGKDPEGKLV